MSKNIDQIFTANPITTNSPSDLMYFGVSPYGVGDDAGMAFSDFAAQFGVIGTSLSPSEAVVTNSSSKLVSLVYTPINTVSTIVSRDSAGSIAVGAFTASSFTIANASLAGLGQFINDANAGSFISFVSNSVSTSIGTDGSDFVGIQTGALVLATDSTNHLPIYLSPGSGTQWGLKVDSSHVVSTHKNTLDNGFGNVTINGNVDSPLVLNTGSISGNSEINFQNSSAHVATIGYTGNNGISALNADGDLVLSQLSGASGDRSLASFNNTIDDGSGNSTWIGQMNLTSNATSATVTTGAMIFTGSSLSIGASSATEVGGTAAEINFGKAYAQRMICLYDGGTLTTDDQNQYLGFGITSNTLRYCVASTSYNHKFYAGTSSSSSNLLFTIGGNGEVTSTNNTLDNGGDAIFAGTVTVTKGSATPGIDIQTNIGGDAAYLTIQNTVSSNETFIGIDGTGLTGIQTGALVIATDSTHGLPIYLTPSNSTNWGLKVINANFIGYSINGRGFPWGITVSATPSGGDQTIGASNILGGIVVTPLASSSFTWTTDSGSNLYSAMGNPDVGTTVQCLWSNNNNSGSAIMTIGFGSGVSGNLRSNTLANNSSMLIYFRCTGVNTFTCYS